MYLEIKTTEEKQIEILRTLGVRKLTNEELVTLCTEEELADLCYENSPTVKKPDIYKPPVRKTAEIVANNPAMNLLLMKEALSKYRDTLINSRLPEEEIENQCSQYLALPIDLDVRLTKIQSAFSLLRKNDNEESHKNRDIAAGEGAIMLPLEVGVETRLLTD